MGGKRTFLDYEIVMTCAKTLLATTAALWMAGSAAAAGRDQRSSRREILTPTELIATAAARRGQTVTVTGFFTWRNDTRALWENHDARLDVEQERRGPAFDYWSRCVTIYPAQTGARRLSDRSVRITGRVVIIGDDDVRSLWTCNRVALEEAVIAPR
jgi:hypothetical protein